jgi:hypothetical protein
MVLLACGCGGSSKPKPAAAVPATRPGPESIFQADSQLHADPAGTLDELKRLGVDRVRTFVVWDKIAPDPSSSTPPAGFDAANPSAYPAASWAPTDAIIRDAASRRVGLDLTITGPPPLWATGPGATDPAAHPQWRPSASDFGAFVHALGTRYSGSYTPPGSTTPLPRASFWAIWNEPNYGQDLAPQAIDDSTVEVSPALYRGLLDAAWSALQASGHGGDTILIGELAPRGLTLGNQPGNFSGMLPLRFLRALYCVDSPYHVLRGAAATERGCPADSTTAAFVAAHPALFHASGFAVHPYPQEQAPNVATPPQVPGAADYADLPAIPRLEGVLDALQQTYGSSTRYPIYSTEYGYRTDPPHTGVPAVSPQQAAEYLNWAEYITWQDPRMRSYDQYLLSDPPPGSASSFVTGLEFYNGLPKATYDAYRLPLYLPVAVAAPGRALEVWGCVRPAHYASLALHGAAQVAQIEFAPARSRAFIVIKRVILRDPHGYFDVPVVFRETGSIRLAWTYPSGQTVHSRAVEVTIR